MEKKIKNNIEIVSLHIPKTAGTSFRYILKEQFKRKEVARLDIYPSGAIQLNEKDFKGTILNEKIRVIQGHYTYNAINEHFLLHDNLHFITWLRDPVERVLSYYYFLKRIIADRLKELPNENLMNRMGKTLSEFVQFEENKNVMSKFLIGADLSNFTFVGFQSDFENELNRLASTMDWKTPKTPHFNNTTDKPKNIDQELIKLIQANNKEDIELYAKALKLRNAKKSI